MSIENVVITQYQQLVDCAGKAVRDVSVPPEGWLCSARKALNMSAAQLSRRLGVSRAQVSQTEKRELTGNVTLKAVQQMAEAMGYRFVYAIVPEESVEDVIARRAKEKATAIVNQSSHHMALESQALSNEQIQSEIERLQKNLMDRIPKSLWNDE